jgi:hypothetical protein
MHNENEGYAREVSLGRCRRPKFVRRRSMKLSKCELEQMRPKVAKPKAQSGERLGSGFLLER